MMDRQASMIFDSVGGLEEVLAAAGPVDDLESFGAAVAYCLGSYRERVVASETPLSREESAHLRAVGAWGLDADPAALEEAARANTLNFAVEHARLIVGGRSATAVADHLGLDVGEIERRAADGSLYAVDGPDGPVFPDFQFTETGALSGLEKVLASLGDDVHPVVAARFFLGTHSGIESELSEDPISPRNWLAAGLPVAVVVEYAWPL